MHSKVLMMRFQRREMQIKRENQKKKRITLAALCILTRCFNSNAFSFLLAEFCSNLPKAFHPLKCRVFIRTSAQIPGFEIKAHFIYLFYYHYYYYYRFL